MSDAYNDEEEIVVDVESQEDNSSDDYPPYLLRAASSSSSSTLSATVNLQTHLGAKTERSAKFDDLVGLVFVL